MPIVSGGLIRATEGEWIPAVASPLPFTETWTVGNAQNTLDGDYDWNGFLGTPLWTIIGGAARLNTASGIAQGGVLLKSTETDDVQATLTYTSFSPSAGYLAAGPIVRMPGTSTFTGYNVTVANDGTTTTLNLWRWIASAQVLLGQVAITPHAGMTATVSALGNRIRAYFDGVVKIDVTDNGIPSGHYVGLQGFCNVSGSVTVDNLVVASSGVVLATYALLANPGALHLTGQAASFSTMANRVLLAESGHLTLTGQPATLRRPQLYLRAGTGALHLTGQASTIHVTGVQTGPTGNILHGNPWVIVQADAAPLTRDRIHVVGIRWIGANDLAQALVTDAAGHRIWSSVANRNHYVGADALNAGLYTGLAVPVLHSGTLEIELA